MRARRLLSSTALVFVAACGTSTIVDPPDELVVATVEVTPAAPSTQVGLSVQLVARALTATGQVVTGRTVTWATSDATVATVDNLGVVTGQGEGDATITATISDVSGSQVVSISAPSCTTRTDVTLAEGESAAYDFTECLLLPAGAAGSRYRVAVARPSLISDSLDIRDVTLAIDPVVTTAAAPARATSIPAPAPRVSAGRIDGAPLVESVELMRGHRAFHEELRERERREGLAFLTPARPSLAPALQIPGPPPDRADMFLQLDCTAAAVPKPVLLIDYNDDIAIYQDSTEWAAAPLDSLAAVAMRDYYSAYARDMLVDYFGVPSDLDGNGRIIVVSSEAVPENAAAAVYSGDLVAPTSCSSSNEGEVVYFDQEVIDNVTASSSNPSALSILAHEVKHVISLNRGIQRGSFHPTWMEEGRAEVAQVMSSRVAWAATGGLPLGSEIDGSDIVSFVQGNGGSFTPEIWGLVVELAEVIATVNSHPNSVITNPSGRGTGHTFYASSWHFHRFLGDHYGGAITPSADAALFNDFTSFSTPSGFNGIQSVVGKSYLELFEELIVAMNTHGMVATSSPGFTTWEFLSATDIFSAPAQFVVPGIYPWPVTHTGGELDEDGNQSAPFAADTFEGPIGPSGVRFHDFVSAGTAAAQIHVTGAGPAGRIIVTRLR